MAPSRSIEDIRTNPIYGRSSMSLRVWTLPKVKISSLIDIREAVIWTVILSWPEWL